MFSEGFYCNSVNEGGGEDIMCGEGERVDVDLTDLSWKCVPVSLKLKKTFLNLAKEGY